MTQDDIPLRDLLEIINTAGVLRRMGNQRCRTVVVDYLPARQALIIPRAADDEPVETMAPTMTEITFRLEDTMFGGVIYAAVTCGSRVVIHPFEWKSYEHLATVTVNLNPR